MTTDQASPPVKGRVDPTEPQSRLQRIESTRGSGYVLLIDTQSQQQQFVPRRLIFFPTAEDEQAFRELAEQWRVETSHLSIASEKANSFAYHQIMAMGEKALPLILRELQVKASDWFWALRAIARDRAPSIPDEDKGMVRRIADRWIEWGKANGYIPS